MIFEQFASGRLYQCDYREMLGEAGDAAVISDPPYGIDFSGYDEHKDCPAAYVELMRPLAPWRKALLNYPEETMAHFVPLFGAPDDCVAWVYSSNVARCFRLWSFWGIKPDFDAVKQPAKNPGAKPSVNAEVRSYDWFEQAQVKNVSAEKTEHPCQIPASNVERIIRLSREALIFDPFMGSGTTAVAAIRAGCRFIGAELSAQYFDIACERIRAEDSQGRLFA